MPESSATNAASYTTRRDTIQADRGVQPFRIGHELLDLRFREMVRFPATSSHCDLRERIAPF